MARYDENIYKRKDGRYDRRYVIGKIFCQDTVAEWLAHWMENELLGNVKVSSYQTYVSIVKKHLLPLLSKMNSSSITPCVVYNFITSLNDSGLSNSTVKGIYQLLAVAMRGAFKEGLIQKNPCSRIKLQPVAQAEQRILTRSEQESVKKLSFDTNDLPTLLSLYTGMRLGESYTPGWSNIDLLAVF